MILRWFISSTVRHALALRKHVRRMLAAQRDLLSPSAIAAVTVAIHALDESLADGHTGKIRIKMEEVEFAAEKNLKPYPHAAWRENIEVLLVALSVAMAIRTFFLQPFKIPTGSMQPTLFGVNSEPDFARYDFWKDSDAIVAQLNTQKKLRNAMVIPTGWQRVKEWFKGYSYIHVVAQAEGKFEGLGKPISVKLFTICQPIRIGGVDYNIWFPPDFGEEPLDKRAGLYLDPDHVYRVGDDVIKIRVSAGDHLFVDRFSYNFHKPERGDIIVFATQGISSEMRDRYRIPDDEFYIKRLVALPDEQVQIGDDRHLRIDGRRLDATTPHFGNVYGFDPKEPPRDSQFSGHVNGTVSQEYHLSLGIPPLFPDEQTVYQVPKNSFMPMGDNTCNSLDSRFFGAVPENYAIGKSFFVYWPLTARFGLSNQ